MDLLLHLPICSSQSHARRCDTWEHVWTKWPIVHEKNIFVWNDFTWVLSLVIHKSRLPQVRLCTVSLTSLPPRIPAVVSLVKRSTPARNRSRGPDRSKSYIRVLIAVRLLRAGCWKCLCLPFFLILRFWFFWAFCCLLFAYKSFAFLLLAFCFYFLKFGFCGF